MYINKVEKLIIEFFSNLELIFDIVKINLT